MTDTPVQAPAAFVGSIPALYDRHLGPVFFEPYALDLAARLPAGAQRVLEIAAGTGRVTRHLAAKVDELVVTDLNEAMLAIARASLPDPKLEWRVADMQALPFVDDSFDVVVGQFGLMFAPDKAAAIRELRRVVRPGGVVLLSTWNELAKNGAAQLAHEQALAAFPEDPPQFYLTPFSLHDARAVCALFEADGFEVRSDTIDVMGSAESAADLAIGLVRGNPIALQLTERGVDVAKYEADVAAALAARFGDHPCRTPLSAHVFVATRPVGP
ncbi:MAG TPA: class I SAM-dependent methyltransferase [Kofleriaceae bacterium]